MAAIKYIGVGVKAPAGTIKMMYNDGDTNDIISAIMYADKYITTDTHVLAQKLKGATVEESCRNVWSWVKKNIKYVLDPLGEQYIKAPAVTYKTGFADCKSRSLFQASLLKCLGIQGAYRFAAYQGQDTYKHVYIVIKINNKLFVSDPDMENFNMEKTTVKTLDKNFNMSKIVYMAGPNEDNTKLEFHKPIDQMNDFDYDLAILKQRDNIQKNLIERISGVGCLKAERFNDRIDMTNSMITVMKDNSLTPNEQIAGIGIIAEMIEKGEYDTSNTVSGIGNLSSRFNQRRALHNKKIRKVYHRIKTGHVPQIGKFSLKKIVKKAATAIKKTVTAPTKLFIKATKAITKGAVKLTKGITKVVLKTITKPAQLAAKATLELLLPKMAPAFIYLFIKDQKLIDKLPEKARRKRNKNLKTAKFIVSGLGMKEDHFMGILRNGIMKKYGKSPEDVLKGMFGNRLSGIGVLPIIMAIIPIITKVIGLVSKLFKKKGEPAAEPYSADDMPDASDFGEMDNSQVDFVSNNLNKQDSGSNESYSDEDYSDTGSDNDNDNGGGGSSSGGGSSNRNVSRRVSSEDRRTNKISG